MVTHLGFAVNRGPCFSKEIQRILDILSSCNVQVGKGCSTHKMNNEENVKCLRRNENLLL